MTPVICQYCGKSAVLVSDTEIYGRTFGKQFWLCRKCDAYVGCHRGSSYPLGILADKELRGLKVLGHSLFDCIWRAAMKRKNWGKGRSRNAAYVWLSKITGIPLEECHFGMMTKEKCLVAIHALEAFHLQLQAKRKGSER
jgi:hypothetical protein